MCEFCSTRNAIDIMVPEEVPLKEEVLYMITPGAPTGAATEIGATVKDALVVFCVDTSGSMGTTTEVRLRQPNVQKMCIILYMCAISL